MKRVLITGGAGFIGHHMVEHFVKNTDYGIVILDKLTYASRGFDRLRDIDRMDSRRVSIITADFSNKLSDGVKHEIGQVEFIIHAGAETHVDRSIKEPEPFIISNVLGTMHMLDFARNQTRLEKFIQFSTDEVYGPAPEGIKFKETDRYNATNPYSASKAGAEQLAIAYANCYKVPIIITNTMNVFGERQHEEKFIPMTIKNILQGKKVIIHSSHDKKTPGSRYWIHARNVSSATLYLLETGNIGESYNIVGEKEVNNLEMARFIANVIGMPLDYEMVDFHSSRPGHDLRYALDGTKLKNIGWTSAFNFEDSLKNTIEWTLKRKHWIGL